VSQRSVVVTGASTGIGRATVVELVSAGFHVFGTVRREKERNGCVDSFLTSSRL
jgi:NAD(P)-dependent dehydrogenase (short-subunit alcohol dehydrogenase family)